jgi:hypothetical protein
MQRTRRRSKDVQDMNMEKQDVRMVLRKWVRIVQRGYNWM